MPATFYTEWNSPLDGGEADLERHDAFCRFAMSVIEGAAPWLLPLFHASNAKVLLATNGCSYLLPGASSTWVEIPEVAGLIRLLPWAEPEETAH